VTWEPFGQESFVRQTGAGTVANSAALGSGPLLLFFFREGFLRLPSQESVEEWSARECLARLLNGCSHLLDVTVVAFGRNVRKAEYAD
jgi:hypothetical protein